MNDILFIAVFVILDGIIAFQILERFHIVDQHIKEKDKLLEENSRLVKAVIAKNANDYVMTTSIDKVPAEAKAPPDPDLVPEESLSDEEFMDSINKQVKK
jgi:hypothetical protein